MKRFIWLLSIVLLLSLLMAGCGKPELTITVAVDPTRNKATIKFKGPKNHYWSLFWSEIGKAEKAENKTILPSRFEIDLILAKWVASGQLDADEGKDELTIPLTGISSGTEMWKLPLTTSLLL